MRCCTGVSRHAGYAALAAAVAASISSCVLSGTSPMTSLLAGLRSSMNLLVLDCTNSPLMNMGTFGTSAAAADSARTCTHRSAAPANRARTSDDAAIDIIVTKPDAVDLGHQSE